MKLPSSKKKTKESVTGIGLKMPNKITKKAHIPLIVKVLVPVIGLIITLGALTTVIVYQKIETTLLEREEEIVEQFIVHSSNRITETLDFYQQLVEKISTDEHVVDHLTKGTITGHETIEEALTHYSINEYVLAIYLMDIEGDTTASTEPTFLNNNYGFRDYFKKALGGQSAVDIARGVTSGKLGYYFAHPIKYENEVIGVAVIKLSPAKIAQVFEEFQEEGYTRFNTEFFLVDEFGVIIYSALKEQLYNTLSEISQETMEEIKTSRRYDNVELHSLNYTHLQENLNKKLRETYTSPETGNLISYKAVERYPLYVLSDTHLDQIRVNTRGIAITITAIVTLAATLTAGILTPIISKTLNPLKKLTELSRAIARGEEVKEVEIKTGDEIEELSKAFNDMTGSLIQARASVEKKVQDQTKELKEQSKALLNVLEDVEKEKAVSIKNAGELKKFKLAVESTQEHIVITDVDGIILYANLAAEKMTGFEIKEMLGKKAGDGNLWGGNMGEKFYKKLWKTIKAEKKTFSGEINNTRKNGVDYIVNATISPILNESGEVAFFVGLERDITKLKDIDRMKTEFISLASHQLRTPLSAMKWYLEMLLDGDVGELDDDQKDMISDIDQSNERMISLVTALLNISRIESGRIIIEPSPTDLGELIESIIKELRKQIKDKKINLVVSVADNLEKINIDPKLIRNVYMNLLTNAIKYTPENGEVHIFVSKKGDDVLSQISDTGYGIPKAAQSRVFEKFFRADNAVKVETEGNGLGLYLAKSIIDSSGGKIWFESEENKGTTFWISLPKTGSKPRKGEVSIDS